jgi:hypothetical protein
LEIETMNKFDALKMFQGWPPEWQRLCAECWIETGEDRPAVSPPVPSEPFPYGQPVSRQVIQCNADAFPFDQPKAAKVAAKASVGYTHSGYPVQLWEKDAIDGMIHQQLNDTAIAKAMELGWPFRRTKRAWEQLAYGRRKLASGKGGCK